MSLSSVVTLIDTIMIFVWCGSTHCGVGIRVAWKLKNLLSPRIRPRLVPPTKF